MCLMFRKNCPRKVCYEPSWLIQVLLVGLNLPFSGLPELSNRSGKSLLNLLRGMVLCLFGHLILLYFHDFGSQVAL